MATQHYDQVWELVMTLTTDELLRVRNLVDALLVHGKPMRPEDLVNFDFLKEGLMSRLPPPITDFTPYQNRKPVEIKGKPLSETIIEERR